MKTKIKEETKMLDRLLPRIALSLWIGLVATSALAEKKYDPGVTDTEIKIGQTVAYSGPVSAYGTIGRTQAAYFRKINDEGGINARRINFISLDDGYVPAKTVEQVRKLIEQDQVFAVFQPIGSASNAAIQKYTNSKKVPVIFAGAISEKIADPRNYPWTIPWNPPASADGRVYGTDPYDGINLYGYTVALTFVEILKRCGDDLTRANLMRQATSLKDVTNPMLLPGIKLNTGATDYHPIEQMQMMRFDGTRWVPFGDVIDAGR
jgi:hypothetical protein